MTTDEQADPALTYAILQAVEEDGGPLFGITVDGFDGRDAWDHACRLVDQGMLEGHYTTSASGFVVYLQIDRLTTKGRLALKQLRTQLSGDGRAQ